MGLHVSIRSLFLLLNWIRMGMKIGYQCWLERCVYESLLVCLADKLPQCFRRWAFGWYYFWKIVLTNKILYPNKSNNNNKFLWKWWWIIIIIIIKMQFNQIWLRHDLRDVLDSSNWICRIMSTSLTISNWWVLWNPFLQLSTFIFCFYFSFAFSFFICMQFSIFDFSAEHRLLRIARILPLLLIDSSM